MCNLSIYIAQRHVEGVIGLLLESDSSTGQSCDSENITVKILELAEPS